MLKFGVTPWWCGCCLQWRPPAAHHVSVVHPSSQPPCLQHHWNMDCVSKPNISYQKLASSTMAMTSDHDLFCIKHSKIMYQKASVAKKKKTLLMWLIGCNIATQSIFALKLLHFFLEFLIQNVRTVFFVTGETKFALIAPIWLSWNIFSKNSICCSPELKIYLIKITQKLGAIPSFSRVCLMNQFLQPECLCISNICHQLIMLIFCLFFYYFCLIRGAVCFCLFSSTKWKSNLHFLPSVTSNV